MEITREELLEAVEAAVDSTTEPPSAKEDENCTN